ncbi:4550_t:CDS:1 [Paraglomus brasilianum]|uniref:4550_t:CDS:1 n=1 Tax=Paraglomus brasilianum TaxID=144538 RepID=A0A9N9H3N7_9GLOM|nr:4550_t:CDS:1 [Paraglomus brasilianum]
MLLTILSVLNYLTSVPQPPIFKWHTFWSLSYLISALSLSILLLTLLDMGRKFYPPNRWNTRLFKSILLQIIFMDLAYAVSGAIVLAREDSVPHVAMIVAQSVLTLWNMISALGYTFFPVITTLSCDVKRRTEDVECVLYPQSNGVNENVDTTSCTSIVATPYVATNYTQRTATPRQHINAQSAAIGAWYMLTTGSLSLISLFINLVALLMDSTGASMSIVNDVEILLGIGITLSLAVTPPKGLVRAFKLRIIGRKLSKHVIWERSDYAYNKDHGTAAAHKKESQDDNAWVEMRDVQAQDEPLEQVIAEDDGYKKDSK